MKKVVILCLAVMLGLCGCGRPSNTAANAVPGGEHIREVEKPENTRCPEFYVPTEYALLGGKTAGEAPVLEMPESSAFAGAWQQLFGSESFFYGAEGSKVLLGNGSEVYVADVSGRKAAVSVCSEKETREIEYRGVPKVPFTRYSVGGKYFFVHNGGIGNSLRAVQAADNSFTALFGEGPSIGYRIFGDFCTEPLLGAEHSLDINKVVGLSCSMSPRPDVIAYYANKQGGGAGLFLQKDGKELEIASFKAADTTYPSMYWLSEDELLLRIGTGQEQSYFLADTQGNISELKGGCRELLGAAGAYAAFYDGGAVEIRTINDGAFVPLLKTKAGDGAQLCAYGFTDDARNFFYAETGADGNAVLSVLDTEGKNLAFRTKLPAEGLAPNLAFSRSSIVCGHKLLINLYSKGFKDNSTWLLDLDGYLRVSQ